MINNETGRCRPAPIFDNGGALLSDHGKYDAETIEENIDKVVGRPFSANLELQAEAVGIDLKLDYAKLEKLLEKEPDSRALKSSARVSAFSSSRVASAASPSEK